MTVTSVPGKLKKQADSYGGIVAALVKLREQNGLGYKAYDYSFQGIIEALTDFAILGNSGDGETPPGWEIITDDDGNIIDGDWQYYPKNGQLWFDERQGRLFVWVDDGFYQTNGNDGLTVVGDNPPTEEVLGGLWYNPTAEALYIWDGTKWALISNANTLTTEDLFLNQITVDGVTADGPVITGYDTGGAVPTQGSFNRWVGRSLKELEVVANNLNSSPLVDVSDTAPASPAPNDLWYNTSNSNLYVYNDSQWEQAFNDLSLSSGLSSLQSTVNNWTSSTSASISDLQTQINNIPLSNYSLKADVDTTTGNLSVALNQLSTAVGDVSRFATNQSLADEVSALNTKIDYVEGLAPDLTGVAMTADLTAQGTTLTSLINTSKSEALAYADQKATEVAAQIPDISGKAESADLQAFIAQAAQNYFPKLGGVLNGTFTMEKTDIAKPSFDFGNAHYYGNKVFKFRTNSSSEQYAEFGTTDTPWEYAWEFGANEDFCWKHANAGKVFSIDEDGPACEKLTIGQFSPNNSDGRRLNNSIEVGERLTAHQSALEGIRTAISQSDDFDTFKTKLLLALDGV